MTGSGFAVADPVQVETSETSALLRARSVVKSYQRGWRRKSTTVLLDVGILRTGSIGYCLQEPLFYQRLTCDEVPAALHRMANQLPGNSRRDGRDAPPVPDHGRGAQTGRPGLQQGRWGPVLLRRVRSGRSETATRKGETE